jgi:hypothetical protein
MRVNAHLPGREYDSYLGNKEKNWTMVILIQILAVTYAFTTTYAEVDDTRSFLSTSRANATLPPPILIVFLETSRSCTLPIAPQTAALPMAWG